MDRSLIFILVINSIILSIFITRFLTQQQNEVSDQLNRQMGVVSNYQNQLMEKLHKASAENKEIKNQLLQLETKFGTLASNLKTEEATPVANSFENVTFIYTITNFTAAVSNDLVGKEHFLETFYPAGFRLRWKFFARLRDNHVSLVLGLVGSNQPFVYAKKTCLLLNADQQVAKYSRHFNSIDRHSLVPSRFWEWPNFVPVDMVKDPHSALLSPRDDALHVLVNLEIYGRNYHLYTPDENSGKKVTGSKDVFAFQQIITNPKKFLTSIESGKMVVVKDDVELGGKWGIEANSRWNIKLSTEKDHQGDFKLAYHVIPQQLPGWRNLYGVFSFAINFRDGPSEELGSKAIYDFKTKEYKDGLHGGTGISFATLEEIFKWYKTATLDLSLTLYGTGAKFYKDIY